MRCLWVACALVAACGGKVPPVIDSVMVPMAPITQSTDGTYKVEITLDIHDDDDAVVALRTTIAVTATRQELPFPNPITVPGFVTVTIPFPSNTPKGKIEIDFVLIDESGLESMASKQFV